jgi:RNA polymerase-binding transcription factor DksA
MNATIATGRLEDRLRVLLGRHAAIEKHFRGQDGRLEADSGDVGSIIEGDEVLEGLEDAARAELVEIRAALHRVKAGSYGTCEKCGGEIADKRLEALPHTRFCVRCA